MNYIEKTIDNSLRFSLTIGMIGYGSYLVHKAIMVEGRNNLSKIFYGSILLLDGIILANNQINISEHISENLAAPCLVLNALALGGLIFEGSHEY